MASHWEYVFNDKLDKLLDGKFGPGMPTMNELEKRTAIALVSTHPVFDYLAPLPENVIPVAGLHIRDTKPLPEVIILNKMVQRASFLLILFK